MINTCLAIVFGLLAMATFVGCGETPRTDIGEAAPGEAAEVVLTEAEIESLAKKQQVCAVTGEPLGSMGTPVPVSVADSRGVDHTVLLCCESCEGELLENPDKYLAKIGTDDGEEPVQTEL